jgi:hypothetical protein
VARDLRSIEQVEFRIDDLTQLVVFMAQLSHAGDGWINLIPRANDEDDPPTSLRFYTLFSGGSPGMTMGTWIPEGRNRRGVVLASLGITHVTGRRAVAELQSLSVPIPKRWFVEQDHRRRGLVLRIPPNEADEKVLEWALRAVTALSGAPVSKWRGDIYLPSAP